VNDYKYKCSTCGSFFSKNEIEDNFVYLCPECGKAEKNRPLEGVLTIEYDYEKIKSKISKEEFLRFPAGKFWLFNSLFPLEFDEKGKPEGISANALERLALSGRPVLEYEYNGKKLLLMDETRNPTFSFKDRASSLVALKAIQLGVNEIAAASTGNAGSSMAGIAARLGLKAKIYVPENIPDAKRIQIQAFGAELIIVDGDYDYAFDVCLEDSEKLKLYNRNTAYNPLTIEGKKSAAFDIFISMKGDLPDNVFVPAGDGVIIYGIYKGFSELKKLGFIEKPPKLIAVQAEGSDAIARFVNTGKFEYVPANTIADSISAGAPRNLYLAAEAVKNSNGSAITVSDDEIISAQKEIAENFGILSEPSSAAAFAGYAKFISKNPAAVDENNLLLITGNGLKDIAALEKWNAKPEVGK